MLVAIGIVAVTLGVVSIFWGGREIGVKGGLILRIFSPTRGRFKWSRVTIGAALIFGGAMIIVHAIKAGD